MAPLSCSDRVLSEITNCPQAQRQPKSLCGAWTYEYKSPYCPYGNQHIKRTYTLLSCGIAHLSTIDKYDEGSDYFCETTTSGWGRWSVKSNGELVITCRTVTNSLVGGSVCGSKEPSRKDAKHSTDTEFCESCADFTNQYTRQKLFDDMEEDKLRAQMRHALENMPSKAKVQTEEGYASYSPLPRMPPCQARCASKPCSQPGQKRSALSSLRGMLTRRL